jgi:CDP-6-deoxy-D-xylo-4-hexulose-3-dehydrase
MTNEELKAEILKLTREYSSRMHVQNRPGNDPLHPHNDQSSAISHLPSAPAVPYAGRVFNEDEVEAAVSCTLDFWLTLGTEGEAMQKELADVLGAKKCLLVNSGSSANLIAVAALTTHKLPAHKRIQKGDEVITCAAGFPTTVAPIIQNGAVPVFIDNDPTTGNARMDQLEAAYVEGKTKAVMFAHTLGNPFELVTVLEFCHKHELWLIEDNCDALGCTYTLPLEKAKAIGLQHLIKIAEKGEHPIIKITEQGAGDPSSSISNHSSSALLTAPTGAFGDISTQSFYPPHHLTMGEGGSVNIIRRAPLGTYAESFRDWGRDCWCPSGKDDTCGKRFQWQLGELPEGYDHKYIYSHIGYNVKPLDPQAAIGRQQIKKLPAFIQARKDNWDYLRKGLVGLEEVFEFSLPTHATGWSAESGFTWDDTGCQTDCSWFGFMLLVKFGAPFKKSAFASYLDVNRVGNRMLFGGNLLRQPAFVQLKKDDPEAIRTLDFSDTILVRTENSNSERSTASAPYPGADRIMNEAIFIGTYPGLTKLQLDYMVNTIRVFVESHA